MQPGVNRIAGGGSRRRSCLLVAALVLGLGVFWSAARGRRGEHLPADVDREPSAEAPVAVAPTAPPALPAARRWRAPAPGPPNEDVVTSDGLPIAPPRGEVSGPAHPHPITPQHQRIYAENRLIGALDDAMEVKDVAGMRRLLGQYRREYPEDDNDLQDGYAVIAACFERPGADARAAAEQWLDAHNGSTLKRFVNRHCLGVE
ncbi:MAG TPA: hypothetical protein VHM31_02350 [Polyangia bacterium]|nr:hypothetical protein [Polyangia bacterium]